MVAVEVRKVGDDMKLTDELKNKVANAENIEEAKKIIEEAGFELSDDEVNAVFGGVGGAPVPWAMENWDYLSGTKSIIVEDKSLKYKKREP
jgi:hypothetical protein